MLPAAVLPVVAGELPLPLEVELALVAGAAEFVELSLLLPPHAASPMPRTRLQAPARIKRLMRFTEAPLT